MVGFSKYEFNKTCNSMVGFSKYEFNNKLLVGVTVGSQIVAHTLIETGNGPQQAQYNKFVREWVKELG